MKTIILSLCVLSLFACSTMLIRNPGGVPETAKIPALAQKAPATDVIRVSAAAPQSNLKHVHEVLKSISKNLEFKSESAQLNPKAISALKDLAEIVAADPSTKIAITGYADRSGSRNLNRSLSMARAQTVGWILIENGISPDRVTLKGIVDKSARATSRRVEIDLK